MRGAGSLRFPTRTNRRIYTSARWRIWNSSATDSMRFPILPFPPLRAATTHFTGAAANISASCPSAYSFYHGRRFHYESSLQAFGEGRLIDDGEGGSEEEYVMLALRLKEGLNFSDYARRFGKPFSANAPEKIKQFARFGFMELDGERLLYPKGLFGFQQYSGGTDLMR